MTDRSTLLPYHTRGAQERVVNENGDDSLGLKSALVSPLLFYMFEMGFIVFGKIMCAVFAFHKVEIVCFRRLDCCFDSIDRDSTDRIVR